MRVWKRKSYKGYTIEKCQYYYIIMKGNDEFIKNDNTIRSIKKAKEFIDSIA